MTSHDSLRIRFRFVLHRISLAFSHGGKNKRCDKKVESRFRVAVARFPFLGTRIHASCRYQKTAVLKYSNYLKL